MKPLVLALILLLPQVLAGTASAKAAPPAALGTSAAVDNQHRLWIAFIESRQDGALVKLARFDEAKSEWRSPVRVTAQAEPISADGENRPKIAFGPAAEIYVTWTSPSSERYTGDIRFARSLDGGRTWSMPTTVHRDRQRIAHRFESLIVDGEGRVWVAWIDKRDLHAAEATGASYTGAAIYYAYSEDRGATWQGDFKLADHSCECCRIALALDEQGRATAMWRHVFAPNERDHALVVLEPRPYRPDISRVTFDRWRIDACPHHGPGLAVGAEGAKHAVWFNQIEGQGRVFYGQLDGAAPEHVRSLPLGAAHADVSSAGRTVAVAWKRFDGALTRVESWISHDSGRTFTSGPTLQTNADSDQPRLLRSGEDIMLIWRHTGGIEVRRLTPALDGPAGTLTHSTSSIAAPSARPAVRAFGPGTMKRLEERYRDRPFWLVIWDLECTYCMKSLANLAASQQRRPDLHVVTITTDPLTQSKKIAERLAVLGVRSEAYAFSGASQEALRYAIDPTWSGEKPRAYRYSAAGERAAMSGVLSVEAFLGEEDVPSTR